MPPLLIVAAAAGAVFGVKALKREWRRINRALDDAERAERALDDGEARPTLRKDRATGEWRPQ